MGLENNVPNSYLNAILQVLYHCKELRLRALRSQLLPYHHQENSQNSLWCELGFLFHMMQHIEVASDRCGGDSAAQDGIEKMVRPANFQRTFQTYQLLPEAAALGLFDESLQKDLQMSVQAFAQFILRQLGRELEAEIKGVTTGGKGAKAAAAAALSSAAIVSGGSNVNANVVDDLFGFSVRAATTFLHSHTLKVEAQPSKALQLDLVYPSVAAKQSIKPGATTASAVKKPNLSCAAVLWGSLQKEIFMK